MEKNRVSVLSQASELEVDDSSSVDARADLMEELMKELHNTERQESSMHHRDSIPDEREVEPFPQLLDEEEEGSSDQEMDMHESPFTVDRKLPVVTTESSQVNHK